MKSITGKFYADNGHKVSDWADEVYAKAEFYYELGGDVIVECWTPAEIDKNISGIGELMDMLEVYEDRQQAARNMSQ